jgi:hypothetical protein
MAHESKRLDALIVDVEDSTTLLRLYIGRLAKAPTRATFYPPLVEHAGEIAASVATLEPTEAGREQLARIADLLLRLARGFDASSPATSDGILRLEQAVDLLEAQLEHMVRGEREASPAVVDRLAGLERSLAYAPAPAVEAPPPHEAVVEAHFEEDPFDEFALTDEFLDELMDGFDAALDASITAPAGEAAVDVSALDAAMPAFDPSRAEPGAIGLSAAEEAALKELFGQIASAYVGPITDFVAKLRVGPVSSSWVDLCAPAVASMTRASSSMGYANLEAALERFGSLLEQSRADSRVVDGDDRAQVLAAYQHLAELLPGTFPLVEPDPTAESESIILNSLLKQIKGVGRITIGRLFAAGLVTLESYYVADPGDLGAAAGLRPSLAEAICEKFRTYRDVSELASDHDLVLGRLESLVQELRAAQFEFKKATLEEWYTDEPSRAKAKARRGRQQCMWKINVALAELNEIDLINDLKDDIYDKRLERLAAFVGARADR